MTQDLCILMTNGMLSWAVVEKYNCTKVMIFW